LIAWPEQVTPFTNAYDRHVTHRAIVCASCLTDEEREHLAVTRVALQDCDDSPF
jgi:hypothetical protein